MISALLSMTQGPAIKKNNGLLLCLSLGNEEEIMLTGFVLF